MFTKRHKTAKRRLRKGATRKLKHRRRTPSLEVLEDRRLLIINGSEDLASWTYFTKAVGKVHSSSGLCTGTLISPVHVLTAAHCVFDNGEYSVPRPKDSFTFITDDPTVSPYQSNDVFWHPGYGPCPSESYWPGHLCNDLAIIQLSSPVDGIRIGLPNRRPLTESELPLAVGYGDTGDGFSVPHSSGIKRWGFVPVDNILPGDNYYQSFFELDESSVCWGDSGGPHFILDENNQDFVIAGVTSYGRDEFTINGYCTYGDNVYTNQVDEQLEWIDQVVRVPTFDYLPPVGMLEDATGHTLSITGVASFLQNPSQVAISATTFNPELFPNPVVTYSSPNPTGSLEITPRENRHGTGTFLLKIADGGFDSDLSTPADNYTYDQYVTVTVSPVNDVPTLDPIPDLSLPISASAKTIDLYGMSSGDFEPQNVQVEVTSANPELIPTPETGPPSSEDASLSLVIQPVASLAGTSTISVCVEDAGLDNDFETQQDNESIVRTFIIDVGNASPTVDEISNVTLLEDAAFYEISLSGITDGDGGVQQLRVTASHNHTELLSDVTVSHNPGETTGKLVIEPRTNQHGETQVLVLVEDGGLDNDLGTSHDNKSFLRTFTVVVAPVNDAPFFNPYPQIGTNITAEFPPNVNFPNMMKFGYDIAADASASRIIVGAPHSYDVLGSVHVVNTKNANSSSEFRLNGDETYHLGSSVSISEDGNTMAFAGEWHGLRVYRRNNDDPQQQWREVSNGIPNREGVERGVYSHDLSSDGNQLIFTGLDPTIFPEGPTARVFRLADDEWQAIGDPLDLDFVTPQTSYILPCAMAPAADYVVIHDPAGGKAYVFDYDFENHEWIRNDTPFAVPAFNGRRGNIDISADGNRVVIATDHADLDTPGGAVVYERSTMDGTWAQLGNPILGSRTLDRFGRVVALGGNGRLLAIGAHLAAPQNIRSGAVYLYELNDGEWELLNVLTDDIELSLFGRDVALSNDGKRLVVASRGYEQSLNTTGFIQIYDISPSIEIGEDVEHRINLTGLQAGGGEQQPFVLTAHSANVELLPDPMIEHDENSSYASLLLQPTPNQNGTTEIVVTIEDAGLDGDLSTTSDNSTYARTFNIEVTPVNDAPTMDYLSQVVANSNAGAQTVEIQGITDGDEGAQAIRVTATSENIDLISNPNVSYTSSDDTGSLTFEIQPDQTGVGSIAVTIEDGGDDNDLTTPEDNAKTTQSFAVVSGVSSFFSDGQNLQIAVHGSPEILAYESSENGITLTLTEGSWEGIESSGIAGGGTPTLQVSSPALFQRFYIQGASGQTVIFAPSSQYHFGDTFLNGSSLIRPVHASVGFGGAVNFNWPQPWTNILNPSDVNNDGTVTTLDCLVTINSLASQAYINQTTGSLVTPASLPEWPNLYVDTSGDGKSTVFDALLILNELARNNNDNGEGELTDVAIQNWSRDSTPISTISQRTEQLTESPSNASAIIISTPAVDHYVRTARDIDAECQSIGSDSLKTIDESILSLLSE